MFFFQPRLSPTLITHSTPKHASSVFTQIKALKLGRLNLNCFVDFINRLCTGFERFEKQSKFTVGGFYCTCLAMIKHWRLCKALLSDIIFCVT